MPTRPRPAWILIANPARARVLQQESGGAMVVLESFVHPAGRGDSGRPASEAKQAERERFAHELGKYLELEARQAHFGRLTIFASANFLGDLKPCLGKATQRLLAASHALDLTSVGAGELERRVSQELALAPH